MALLSPGLGNGRGSIGCSQPRGMLAESCLLGFSSCLLTISWSQLGFCRAERKSIWLPSRSPLDSCPQASVSPPRDREQGLALALQAASGRVKQAGECLPGCSRFSRPGSSHDCSRQGSGFPAPLTSDCPLLPLRAFCPSVTSVSPCPSVWDQGRQWVEAALQPEAWQLLRGD